MARPMLLVTYRVVAVERYPADAVRRTFTHPARLVLTLLHRKEFRLLRRYWITLTRVVSRCDFACEAG